MKKGIITVVVAMGLAVSGLVLAQMNEQGKEMMGGKNMGMMGDGTGMMKGGMMGGKGMMGMHGMMMKMMD